MKLKINIPQKWNELSARQLKQISLYLDKGYQDSTLCLLVFLTLADIRWYQLFKLFKLFIVLIRVPLLELANYFPFIYHEINLTKFIPAITIQRNKYSGPADRLGNITIDELAHADDAYLKYHHTKNITYLRFLTAVLYRETSGYDLRYPFIKEELPARMKKFNKIDQKTLLAIMRSYQGCRQHIENQFKNVFPKPKEGTKNKKRKPITSSQFSKLILDLTGDKFGTHKETASTNALLFLADFDNKIVAQRKQKLKLAS